MIDIYSEFKEYLQTTLVPTPKGMTGIEGAVWYFCKGDVVKQLKCKPQHIQDIHFKSDKIPYHSIYITIINALENQELSELSVDFIKELLLEEFTVTQVENATRRIEKTINQVKWDKEWQQEVLEHYQKLQEKGLDIHEDKGMVMRYFAEHYPKDMCGKIFNFLW